MISIHLLLPSAARPTRARRIASLARLLHCAAEHRPRDRHGVPLNVHIIAEVVRCARRFEHLYDPLDAHDAITLLRPASS